MKKMIDKNQNQRKEGKRKKAIKGNTPNSAEKQEMTQTKEQKKREKGEEKILKK